MVWAEDFLGVENTTDYFVRTGTNAAGGVTLTASPDGNSSTELSITTTFTTALDEEHSVTTPLAMKIAIGCLIVIMLVFSLVGNSVICFIVYRKPAMRSAINILLANMGLANILLALLCLPFAFVSLLLERWVFGDVMCRLVAFLHGMLVSEAACILLTISVDRYLIIVCRKDTLTPWRAKVIIIITWCLSVLVSLPPTVGWGLYHYYSGWMQCVLKEYRSDADKAYIIMAFMLMFYIPMITMTFSYLCIARTVRQNSLKVHVQPQSMALAQAARIGLTLSNPPWVSVDVSFKTRAFKTVLILFIIYVICWLPYSLCLLIWNFERTLGANYISGTVVLWLGYMNCSLNPIIYCWRIQKFREACLNMLPKSFPFLPNLPSSTKRRINPSAAYECNNASEQQSVV